MPDMIDLVLSDLFRFQTSKGELHRGAMSSTKNSRQLVISLAKKKLTA